MKKLACLMLVIVLTICLGIATVSSSPVRVPDGDYVVSASSGTSEFRAFWADAWNEGIKDAVQVAEMVQTAADHNYNAVIVQVRKRGDAYYFPTAPNSEPRPGELAPDFDPLAEVITQAHSQGLEVIAWINTYLIASPPPAPPPADPGHVFNLHPELLTENSAGEKVFAEGYYLDPGHPGANAWNRVVALDLVNNYDLDGIKLDYFWYPDSDSGYNQTAIDRYNSEFGLSGRPDPDDLLFQQWRRRQLNDWLRVLYAEIMAVKPQLKVMVSVAADESSASSNYYQDWYSWLEEKSLDAVLPMNYTTDNAVFFSRAESANLNKAGRYCFMGQGSYLNTKENSVYQLSVARAAGSEGLSTYSYRQTNSAGDTPAVFYQYIRDNIFNEAAEIPPMAWKVTPTSGIFWGVVSDAQTEDPIYNARVEVAGSSRSTLTDCEGRFALIEIAAGTYALSASADGYSGLTVEDVSLGAGEVVVSNFSLQPLSPPPPTPEATPTPEPFSPTPTPDSSVPTPRPTATVGITPGPTPIPQQSLYLGPVTVYADFIHGGSGWPKVASGNVNLNGVIYAEGDLQIDREGGIDGIYSISGDTRLYVQDIPLPWNPEPVEVTLYQGEFSYEVDANGLILDYLNRGLEFLQVAGLEAEIKTISFLGDGVELSADLYFPGQDAAIEVGRLRISRSEGMLLTGYILVGGVEIEIEDLEVTADKLVLNYGRVVFPEYLSPGGVRFEPKLSEPAPLKTASLSLDFLALPEEDTQSEPVITRSDLSAVTSAKTSAVALAEVEALAKAEALAKEDSFNEGGKQSQKVSTRSFICGQVEDRETDYAASFAASLYRLTEEEPSESDELIDIAVVSQDGRYEFKNLPAGDYAVKMGGRVTVEIIGLEISADGFYLAHGEVTNIPDLEYAGMILAVESLSFSTDPLGVELKEVILILPEILGGGMVSLDLLQVTEQGVNVVGEVVDFSFTIPNSGFGLTIDEFYFDTINDRFGGLGRLHAPTLPAIVVGVGFSGREVSWVHAEVQEMNYPIYAVVFLQRVSLEIEHLESGPPPPIIVAAVGLSAGPTWSIPGTSDSVVLLAADPISLTVDTGDYGELVGDVTLFKPSSGTMTGRLSFLNWGWDYSFSGFDLTGLKARLSRSQGFTASSYLDIIDILKGTSTVSIDRQNRISGSTVGTLQVPSVVPLLGGRKLGGFNSLLNNSYLAGEGWASRLLSVAVRFDYDGKVQFGRNLSSLGVRQLSPSRLAALKRGDQVPTIEERIEVPEGMRRAVFRFAWEEGDTEVTLITPSAEEIAPADAPLTSDYCNYLSDPENREAWYVVKEPAAGLWGYIISNPAVGELTVELLELEEPPSIEMAAPPAPARLLGPLGAGQTIRLSWGTTGLTGDELIGLYYDERNEGFTGKLIADGIPADQGYYDWAIDETVPPGRYFIYAVLDNGRTAPSASYMPGSVTLSNPLAPAPPENLEIAVNGLEVTAGWDANPEADLIGYLLEWTDDLSAVDYENRLAVGLETSHTISGLTNGREYKVRVKALNDAGYESLPSQSQLVLLNSTAENRSPRIVSKPQTSVRADTPYSYQVEARDDDGDDLNYSLILGPEGMEISPAAGLIQWTPAAEDVGLVEVEVEVSDAADPARQHYFIGVYNNYMANIAPVITSSPQTTARAGVEYVYQFEAYDLDDDPLEYSLADAPDGMTITGQGLIRWTPAGSDLPGEHLVEARVSDGQGGTARQVFTIILKGSPAGPDPTPSPPEPVTPTPEPTPAPAQSYWIIDSGDYTGDGTAEIAVFRPENGLWAVRGITRVYFGRRGDLPVPGDYTGDGTAEIAVFRPDTGLWAVRGHRRNYFGRIGDISVPGDYTGDGTVETAVFRPSSGLWAIRDITRVYFGRQSDFPVPGYYVGDGTADIAVFRPNTGLWAVRGLTRAYFGKEGDLPVPGDYLGMGHCNPAVFRPISGLWAVRDVARTYFGRPGDVPIPADYGGYGLDEIGIFRPSTGLWAIRYATRAYFGREGDIPVTR